MGLGEKGDGIKYKLAVTKWSQGCKIQPRNIVNTIIVTRYGAR